MVLSKDASQNLAGRTGRREGAPAQAGVARSTLSRPLGRAVAGVIAPLGLAGRDKPVPYGPLFVAIATVLPEGLS